MTSQPVTTRDRIHIKYCRDTARCIIETDEPGESCKNLDHLLDEVGTGAQEDALADFYEHLCQMHMNTLLRHGDKGAQGLALAIREIAELIPEDKKQAAVERWAEKRAAITEDTTHVSYVLSTIHPPTAPAAFGKAVVYAGQFTWVGHANREVALEFARAGYSYTTGEVRKIGRGLLDAPGREINHPATGLAFRIDPADNAPHPCPCCGRLVLPTDHAYAYDEDACCLGCITWSRDVAACQPGLTAHSGISPERWEKLLDRVDEQLVTEDTAHTKES